MLEKIVHRRVVQFLDENNIAQTEFGFHNNIWLLMPYLSL